MTINTFFIGVRKKVARALYRASLFVYNSQFREEIIIFDDQYELAVFEIVNDDYGAGFVGSTHLPDVLDEYGISVNVFDEGITIAEYDETTGKFVDVERES